MIRRLFNRWFKIDWRIYKRPPVSLSTMDGIMKEFYLPVIKEQLERTNLILGWTELTPKEKAERAAKARHQNLEELGKQVKSVMEKLYADSGTWPDEVAQYAIATALIWYEENEVSYDW